MFTPLGISQYLWRVERWQFQRRGDSQVGLTDPTVRIDLDIGRPLAHVLSAASTLSSRAVPSRQPHHALPARSLDERNVMLSCMFGLSARSFGQETVFVSSLYSKEWMCNVSPFHTRYDTHTMLKGLSGSRRPQGVNVKSMGRLLSWARCAVSSSVMADFCGRMTSRERARAKTKR